MTRFRDAIGQRGEWLFALRISVIEPIQGPLFRPQFLGDKSRFVDFIVFLNEPGFTHLFFLVQVKTTQEDYTAKERRLKVQVSEKHIQELALCPAPTYIIGVHEETEAVYLVSANGENLSALSSLNTSFQVNDINRASLRQEVIDYWQQTPRLKLNSVFQDRQWR